ncbi:MAG: histidinol-phosphate transaminase [Gammaproteobacteria bacterium]|nr:histidinol-phosphate transaminase [Gammaproteobacteria bacterium]
MTIDIRSLAVPGVRSIEPYQPGKPLSELQREYGIADAIKLASNENPIGPSPYAIEAARATLAELARYPDGGGFALKRALSTKLDVAPEQITLGNGSNDVLEFMARAFATTGDEVIYSEHAFAVYELVARAVGAKPMVVPARAWGHDLAAMRDAFTPHTRLVFIANPNNPTGTWLKRDDLEAFIRSVPINVLVVVDEAYFEYVAESDYPNAVQWVARYPNLVVTRTFSKIYGLAALRIGYGVSHPHVADYLNRVRQPFNVNSVAAAAAEAALADDAHVARGVALNRAGMEQITEGLTGLGLDFIPSVGNFVSFDVRRPARPVYDALLRAGVIVRPVASYGMPQHLRVTIGLAEENRRFLTALADVLRDAGGTPARSVG